MLQKLRYGTVCINHWPALGFAFGTTPWGGHPSATLEDIQSGRGWVHNTFMLEDIEKCVIRGPLVVKPKPTWFAGHKTAAEIGRKLVEENGGAAVVAQAAGPHHAGAARLIPQVLIFYQEGWQ